ncbi:YqaA family protein [uncultured Devosia sp.]|uniref:YqaA family protein n=1 Tax=uncultured Devosia sp. TaxID=211434 RepID=UPI00260D596E|nr:YqaA family protein [uncultured Devosia sp.]
MTDTTQTAKPGLYERLKAATGHPLAEPILALICFLEAMIVPVFPEVMLAPMILADRRRAWRLATICTVFSVVGGIFGYAIGYYLFDTIGKGIVEFYGAGAGFEQLRESFVANGPFMIMVGAVTPIPYKIITITSGVAGIDIWTFILYGLIGRGLRFFFPCGLFYFFGPVASEFIEKHKKWAGWVMLAAIIGGFAAAPLLFPKHGAEVTDRVIERTTGTDVIPGTPPADQAE